MALALGKDPTAITDADLPAIKEKLAALKANAAMVGEVTPVQTALATGEVDILVGGGEWVTAGLAKETRRWTSRSRRRVRFCGRSRLAMFEDSKNKDMALKFIQYIMSPEGQARLATSSCYWGMPANTKAALTDGAEEDPALRRAARLSSQAPSPIGAERRSRQEDAGVWTEMLQGK